MVAVVVVLTAGAFVARVGHSAIAPAATSRTVTTASQQTTPARSSTSKSEPVATVSTYVESPRMIDTRHGFALIASCTRKDASCPVTALAVTQDGVRWTRRAVPAADQSSVESSSGAPAPDLTALGPRSAFYQATPGGPRSGYFTADAGLTWTAVPAGVNGTVDSIPAGGVLQAMCPSGGSDPCRTVALTVRLPSNGQLAKLAHQPDMVVESAGAAPLGDGAWWVTGTRAGRRALAVSRDSGRTWTTSVLPAVRGQYLYTSAVTGTGGQLWALAIGQLPDVKNGLLAVYRSTDNGRSWSLSWTTKAGQQSRSALGVAIVSGKRGTICEELVPQRAWSSTDGGKTFTETTCPTVGFPLWSAAGYLSTDASSVSVSADGVHWTSVKP